MDSSFLDKRGSSSSMFKHISLGLLGLVVTLGFAGSERMACAAYQDVVLADSPVAYWRVDETSGSTATNIGSLGSSANATYYGTHTKGQTPLVADGTSIRFTNGRVSPGQTSGISTGGPFTEKTIELWFQANSVSGRQVLFEQGGGTRGLNVYLDGSTLYVAGWNRANDDGGGAAAPWGTPTPVFVSSGTPIQVGEVYHVVLVMDGDAAGTTGTIEGFLNGQSFGSSSGVGRLWNHNPAEIGDANAGVRFHDNNTSSSNREFDGYIDEVALYNVALSSTRIQAHYDEGINDGSTLVGHWKLDEVSGTTATDESSSSNDGTLQGTFTFDTASVTSCPITGNALEFNGTDDHIAVPSSSSLQITDELTIVAWVRGDNWGSGTDVDTVVRKGSGDPTNYQLAIANRKVTLYLDDTDDGGIQGDTSLDKETWFHVAATWDGSEVRIYVNGVLDMAAPVAYNGTLGFDSRDLHVGGHPLGDFFDGLLDDVRVYNVALTAGEVSAIYGLVGHWKLDESSGSTASDNSGNGNDGSLAGSPTWRPTGGKVDGALEFYGSEYVTIPDPAVGTGPFSFTAWVYTNSLSGYNSTWGTGFARSTQNDSIGDWVVGVDNDGSIHFGHWTTSGSDPDGMPYTADGVITAGVWYHVAFTWDGSTQRIYVDGAELTPAGTHSTASGWNTGHEIGRNWHTGPYHFDGLIDDARIYDRALCAEEIAYLDSSTDPKSIRIIRWLEVQ
ncbi:MAG: LamG domain-containing protein [Planctomycetota bacterium]|nr:MAG: LamG domain-containing protein [Planctomycetota bacterium]REJ90333.1 MAG: LamG domain-containing protein [Planctomycetota bacterium]